MPDLSDLSKENVKKGKMGGSASKASEKFSRNPYNHHDEEQLTAEERQVVSTERPSRPTPPNRPLPVLSESTSEPRKNFKSKEYIVPLDGTSSASSSPGMLQRKHTPATIPRTKFTSATPLEQRIAINSLRQKLDYEEAEQGDSKRRQSKKEMHASKRIEVATSATGDDKASVSSMTESQTASQMESETSDVVDTTRIVQRLTQVQDYLKQATSLYVNLSTKVHLEDSEMDHIEKLGKLIQQLRLQEQGYVDLLQRTLDVDESADITPSSSVLSLQQEEPRIDGSQQQELEKLQMQHALLKKIVDQQQQIQNLKRKQATLASLQEQAEDLIKSADDTEEQAFSRIWNEESKEGSAMNSASTFIAADATSHDEIDDEGTALFDADMVQRKLELESKLMSLQAKKEKMDSLLSTLKASRDTIEGASSSQPTLKSSSENGPTASNQQAMQTKRAEIEQQQQNAVQAMQQAKDLQAKLQKLKEVKKRLEDLTHIVAEYEQSHVEPVLSRNETSAEDQHPHSQLQAGYGGARPRDDASSVPLNADHNSRDMTNGLDNRMRPAPPGGRSQRTAIDVTRNPSSRDIRPPVVNGASALGKNLATENQDNDLSSKIKQLQEARQRLAFIQQNTQLLALTSGRNEQAIISSARETESESEPESVSTAEDLSWQEDPEFQAKVRRLQQAKEKLKHLQELVDSVQQDGLVMDELANISLSSKEQSDKEEEEDENDFNEEEADEDGEITSEQQSDENREDDGSETSSATEEEKIDGATREEAGGDHLSDAAVNFDKELEYQTTLKQQKQELEKLLLEKQKLLDAQRQLSEIARNTLATENEAANQGKQGENASKDVKKQPKIKFDGESEEKLPLRPAIVGKDVSRVKYEGMQVPRIVKRTSNLSVEPQYGSDSDIRVFKKRNFLHARKNQTGHSLGSRPNPLVMSELRRQREMFEQNKKLKFVEKQRRIRDSGDDNRSDGGTYSIRSDLDEGVGHSMFSADVTTAATWGGSTEQSSSEEDSAVGEEDFPEEVEIDDEYEGNMDQPEEEEEDERIDEELEGDDVAPLLDFKAKIGKQKSEKTWFRARDRVENHNGKKRKLDSTRNRSTVSWSMNVSPDSSARQRERQLNLTPAHKLMRERTSRKPDASNSLWEEQCELLRQQLTSSTSLSTSLLRNQQTLLTMLQNQTGPIGGGEGFRFDGPFTQFPRGPLASGLGLQRSTNQQQQQQQQQILHTLERCTNQLDRQHQEIQSLQREFHNMVLRQSTDASTRRVYAWDEHAPSFGNYDQRKAFGVDGRNQNESFLGSTYKSTLPHPSSGPLHVFGDETQSRFTQTETPSSQPMKHNEYGMVSEVSNQRERDANFGQFLPFRLNEFRQVATSSTRSTAQVDERSTSPMQRDAEYNPLIYADSQLTSGAKVDSVRRSRDVISTSYPTPSKSKAAMNLAERQRATWPSFLKEAENIDSQSERSASNFGEKRDVKEEDKLKEEVKEAEDKLDRLSVASNFSLFETMRDSIYSEVATLISMNESRPHYLVELFRELQLLTSDYLRQRALYALQDLVTRFLTEDSEMRQSNEPTEEVYRKWIGTAGIDETPSESFATSDDEQQEAKALEALSSQIRNNDMYDYAEVAESGSTMSTPTSNQDPPFAAEGLGDTVINLDEALQKMRSYEERMAEARKKVLNDENNYDISMDEDETIGAVNVAASENSSAYDVASETSSELQQPSIDTQKLDKQIKSIMMDLIPFLNEHMESHCSPKFLNELNSLIFKLAKQKEPGAEKQEFGRSFHRQLESVLKDSLCRFEGRSLKECGEDILINVSELLFNELAFFRLMQDLDRPTAAISGNIWTRESGNHGTSDQTHVGSHPAQNPAPGVPTTFYDSSSTSVGLLVNTSGTIFSPPAPRSHGIEHEHVRIFEDGLELQDVKESEENDSDAEDEIEASRQLVNVELSVSESRPVASTGSGEEDVEEDQQSFPFQNIPPESSVGVQQQQQQQQRNQQDCAEEQRDANSPGVEGHDDVNDMPEDDGLRCSPRQENIVDESESGLEEDERGEDEREEDEREEDEREEDEREEDDRDGPDSLDAVAGTEREAHDTGNEDGDESEVTVDDLPTKLTGLTEADLQTRMQSEQNAVEGTQGVLSHLSDEQELADESTTPQQQQPPQQQDQLPQQQDQQEHYDHALKKESE